jgi:hypothetical protein
LHKRIRESKRNPQFVHHFGYSHSLEAFGYDPEIVFWEANYSRYKKFPGPECLHIFGKNWRHLGWFNFRDWNFANAGIVEVTTNYFTDMVLLVEITF